MDVGSITLDTIYVTETVDGVVRFVFGGDTSFGRRFLDPKADQFSQREIIFCSPDAIIDCNDPLPGSQALFSWVKPYFENADYPVVNLESAVTKNPREVHMEKDFVYFSLPESLPALRSELGVNYVNLGNNHVYDYQEAGIEDTLQFLNQYGYVFSGAGHNSDEAYAPYFEMLGGTNFGFVSATTASGYQWDIDYVANKDEKGGAADLRDDELLTEAVNLVKAENAVAIVFAHTGKEYTVSPTGYASGRFSASVAAGADLIIGHHPHVSQGFEVQDGVFIAHCLGNFAFDQSRLETMMALVAEVDQKGKKTVRARGRPIYLEDYRPRPLVGDQASLFLRRLGMHSRNVLAFGYNGDAYIDLGGTSQKLEPQTLIETVTIPVDKNFGILDLRGKMMDGGSIASIAVTGNPSKIYVGHDIMEGHGEFEDNDVDDDIMEASRWDVSSGSSSVCMENVFRGVGALCSYRKETKTDDAVVAFRNRIRVPGDEVDEPNKFLTLMGYNQGQDAGNHFVVSRYYASYGSLTFDDEESFTLATGGTYDWRMFYHDLNMPPDAPGANTVDTAARAIRYFFRHSPPLPLSTADGEGVVRVDDVATVSWDIATASDSAEMTLSTPNNKDFIRVEGSPGKSYQVTIQYERYAPKAPRCNTEIYDCPPGSEYAPTEAPSATPSAAPSISPAPTSAPYSSAKGSSGGYQENWSVVVFVLSALLCL